MARQIISTGSSANDGTGDPLRTAFTKCNDNFQELYATGGGGGTIGGSTGGTSNAILRADGTGGITLKSSGITIADGASGTLSGTNSGDVTLASPSRYLSLAGQQVTANQVDLTSHVTGALPLANLAPASVASVLLGRGSAAAGGSFQEITLGSGLSMSGTTLSSTGGGVTDGDKGDITVSVVGTVWTIDNSAVTYAKIQNVSATDKILGRQTAGAGTVEEITCTSAGRALLDDADAAAQRTTLQLGTAATKDIPATGNASSTQVVYGTDTRLSDSRTPTAHAASHASGGSDALTLAQSQVTNLTTDLAAKAPLASPALTGTPTSTTATADTNTTQIATTAYVVGQASSTTPAALGTAAVGTSLRYARADHVHALPTINLATGVTGTLPVANGGTGQATVTAAFNSLSPGTTKGDLIVHDGTNEVRLAVGATNGHVLTVDSTAATGVKWAAQTGGSGGGSTNVWIPAAQWIPRTTTGCGIDSREQATGSINTDELLFDPGTAEYAQAMVVMPSNYNNSTFTARFYWTASSGTASTDVVWNIRARAFGDNVAIGQAFSATAATVTDTYFSANQMHVSGSTGSVTVDGTPAANKAIIIEIYRDAASGSDTLGSDARFLGLEIAYTSA